MNSSNRTWMWSLLAMMHVLSHFHRLNLNVLADSLMLEFNLSGVALGNLAAAYSYTYVLMLIPGGLIIDRWGSRRSAFMIALFMGGGAIVFGMAQGVAGIFAGRLLIGLGGSIVLINMMKFQSEWYRKDEFATINGLAIFIGAMGGVLATFPLAYIAAFTSWRLIFQVAGLITIVLGTAALIWLRDRPIDRPEAIIDAPGLKQSEPTMAIKEMLFEVVQNKRYWFLFIINFGIYGSYLTFSGAWGVTYLMQIYEVSREQASLLISPTALGAMLGAPLAGYISDRQGKRVLVIFAGSILFMVNWLLLTVVFGLRPPLELIYVISFNLGLSVSATMLTLTYAKENCKPCLVGTATGFANMGNFLGAALLQSAFGYILQRGVSETAYEAVPHFPYSAFQNAFYFCLVIIMISTAMNLILGKLDDRHLYEEARFQAEQSNGLPR